MRRWIFAVGTVASLIPAAAAAAAGALAPAKQLEPTTAWRLDYGAERCSLAQQYGAGQDAVLLQIDSYGSRDEFVLTLAGRAIPRSLQPIMTGGFRFPGDPAGREARFFRGTDSTGGQSAASFLVKFLPYEEYERRHKIKDKDQLKLLSEQPEKTYPDYERQVTAIAVAFDSGTARQLNVHDLVAPLKALRKCVDSLDQSWGVDPSIQSTLSRPAVLDENDIPRLVSAYPQNMLRSEQSALVLMRMSIDASGKPTSCVIQVPVVDPALKTAICRNLVHFKPALDREGKPVASVYTNTVVFRIPT
ncbi:MAG: hypothetical protein J2O44_01190 [Porphyrobacter sp.]|nr:hypothetical protein [Porphyrobacter sp.]